MLLRLQRPLVDSARAYDDYAPRYDRLLVANRINAYMRQEMSRTLLQVFASGTRLIELGCGTGDEAIALALKGCKVTAFDPSPRMIEIASHKADEAGVGRDIRFVVARGSELDPTLAQLGDATSFDGAYASFSLSYEPDLFAVVGALAGHIRPGGRVVIAIMNRVCLIELAAAALSGHPALAGRRIRSPTVHKVGKHLTAIFPRSAEQVERALRPAFVLEWVRALPAIIPPHYANRAFKRWPALLDLLRVADDRFASMPFIRRLGDHTILRFRRAG